MSGSVGTEGGTAAGAALGVAGTGEAEGSGPVSPFCQNMQPVSRHTQSSAVKSSWMECFTEQIPPFPLCGTKFHRPFPPGPE